MREVYQGSRQQSSIQYNNIRKNKKYISNKALNFLKKIFSYIVDSV
jgi:hypothetical protein